MLHDHVFLPSTDSFVNSQEWTLSRSVPEIRIGIIGSINSGKSALVHRYLTGSYMQVDTVFFYFVVFNYFSIMLSALYYKAYLHFRKLSTKLVLLLVNSCSYVKIPPEVEISLNIS